MFYYLIFFMNEKHVSLALFNLFEMLGYNQFKENTVFGSAALVLKKKYPNAGDIDILATEFGFEYAKDVLGEKNIPVDFLFIANRESVALGACMSFKIKNDKFDIFNGRYDYVLNLSGSLEKKEKLLIYGIPVHVRPQELIKEDLWYELAELDAASQETEGIKNRKRKISERLNYLEKNC